MRCKEHVKAVPDSARGPYVKEAPGDSKGEESLDASDGLDEEVFAYGEYP
ncbi:MAG: hypothetical protein ABGZ53_21925 [Fuerstiella sp.]